jgi:glutamyl-tRNA synthetase
MISEKKLRFIIRKYALQNAVQFEGKADRKAVIGKIIAEVKKEGISPKAILPLVDDIVKEVNKIPYTEQLEELKEIAPELIKKEKKERKFVLPELPNAEKGKVVTRFPPEPNGYLHIGHAKAAIIDHEYARMYSGIFILRFDDTNPENEELKFYEAQKEDLRWLGIEWDKEYNTSDNIKKHYKLALQLIEQGDAYVCTCKSEEIKENRFKGVECKCRKRSSDENRELWREMQSNLAAGRAILRLKGNMKSENTAMRDPTLFRIIEAEHPIQGDRYRVWPTYDFAGAIEDSLSGVTHPFRTKEYELRDEVYYYILEKLNLRKPYLMEFSRLAIEGMPVSKRLIKPLIEKGQVEGYDDIRLPTLRGLKRRGILPETIKQFVLSQGISKVESKVTFDQIEAINRKIIDPIAKRYFFVSNPTKLIVENAPEIEKTLKLHPTKNLGYRKIKTKNTFYISEDDVEKLKVNDKIRLKDLYNIQITKINNEISSRFIGTQLMSGLDKIQWVTEEHIDALILKPDLLFKNGKYNENSLEKIKGYVEKAIEIVNIGETVQFERFGFVKIERKGKDRIVGIFIHK